MRKKTVLITTQAQPSPFLITLTDAVIKIKRNEAGHKWLCCMFPAAGCILITVYSVRVQPFFANKWIFFSRNVSIRNKLKFFNAVVAPIASFWAPMHPQCTYGQRWHQLSTYDPMHGWSSRRDLLRGIRGTKFISACEKWWEHVTWKHGQKLALLNIGNLPVTSSISFTNVGYAECYIGNLLEEDLWDVQQWIGRPKLNIFLDLSIGVTGRRWLQMLTGGWWRRTSSWNFVLSRPIRLTNCLYFPLFLLVRALNRACFRHASFIELACKDCLLNPPRNHQIRRRC